MLLLASKMLTTLKTVKNYTPLLRLRKQCILVMLMLSPGLLISQSNDSTSVSDISPWEIDASVAAHSLFGKGLSTLPGSAKLGLRYDAAVKYKRGNFGFALSGGFWSAKYTPTAPGTTFRQRLKTLSAHYVMFGPYFTLGEGKTSFEINPKVGVQRFYFPHLTGVSQGQVTQRVSTNFGAGVSAGLGVKALFPVDDLISIHASLDYMTTLGEEAFRYNYRVGSNTTVNTKGLSSISLGAGASISLKSTNAKEEPKSFEANAIDIALGAGLNFLTGKGIDNLPGEKSVGFDTDLTLNYRIGRSGIAFSGGFWSNKYDAKSATEGGIVNQRLDNLSAHYVSLGPIIPVTPKTSKINLELVPHVGLQRLYFPHSSLSFNNTVIRRVATNLQAGWSAGLSANLMIPIDPKLDLKVGADYTSMLTDRGFGFTVRQNNGYSNREVLQRINVGVGVVYNIMKKVVAVDSEMTPEQIAEMIDAKEDDTEEGTDTENKDGIDMQVGGERDGMDKPKEGVDTTIETIPSTTAPTTAEPVVPNPVVTNPTTAPTTITPTTPSSTEITTPSTSSPVYTNPGNNTNTYQSDNAVYRVQFVALSKDVKVFNELKQYGTVILEYYSTKGLYRYMVGDATTEEEGMALLNRVHANGWPKAFLVKYQDGKRTRIQ